MEKYDKSDSLYFNLEKEIEDGNLTAIDELDDKVVKFKNRNDKIFFYRKESNWFTELLCDKLAAFYDIPVVQHKKTDYKGFVGVISENFHRDNYNYIDGEELITSFFSSHPELLKEYGNDINKANSIELIWWSLENRYKNYPNKDKLLEKLIKQFISIYEFSIIVSQGDLHINNYQIEENDTDANLAPIFDNAMSFLNTPIAALGLEQDDVLRSTYTSLRKYLEFLPREDREAFMEKVNRIKMEDISQMADEILDNTSLSLSERKELNFEKLEIIKRFLANKRNILSVNKEYLISRSK